MLDIKEEDLKAISYSEFGEILESLTKRLKDYQLANSMQFNVVVPILRSGAFTGMHIASKLGITDILPVQYKYEYFPEETIVQKIPLVFKQFSIPLLNILICDTKTVFGGIAQKVVSDVRTAYPDANLYFASATLDISKQKIDYIEEVFHGVLINDRRTLRREDSMIQNVINDILVFPWEDKDEQWRDISTFI